MICLFDKMSASNTGGNGICTLDPTVCTVSEVAGGSYELHMEHPMDSNGKYLLLAEDMIIKAPVPRKVVPEITLPETKVWKVTTATSLYSKLPVYKKKQGSVSQKDYKNTYNDPTSKLFNQGSTYSAGSIVTVYKYPGVYVIYKADKGSTGVTPGGDSSIWKQVGLIDPNGQGTNTDNPTYDPGVIAESLAVGAVLSKIADFNGSYIQVKSGNGNVGYVARDCCEEQTITEAGEVIPAQTITEQAFRIYNVEAEDDTQTVIVDAKHISYDFIGNALYDCKLSEADPQAAISLLKGSLMYEDTRVIACNITGKTITKDWSYKNPINALLDPDDGLVPVLKAMLVRNNNNFFILDGSNPQTGITIDYGVNMRGVSWSRSSENVITRIVPRCKNGDNTYLYLESINVDSPNINLYPFPKIEVLNCNYQVGKEFEKPDGTKVTMTEQSCREQMLADAQKRFDEDHVDTILIELEVEFVLLGDTEEYKQYKDLQSVNLYDMITINTGKSAITTTAQVSEYEYDCILKRYNSIKLGTISTFNRRLAGYRLCNNSIGIDKLAPDLVDQILSAGESSSSNSGSSDGGSGSGVSVVTEVYDGLDSTSTSAALSANQGRVLNGKIPSVYDGLDGTSTSSALSAKQGKVLNEKSTFKTPTKTDTSSSANDSAIALAAFQKVDANSCGFVAQDSTTEVRYCIVLKRSQSAGTVLLMTQAGLFKYFNVTNGAISNAKSISMS